MKLQMKLPIALTLISSISGQKLRGAVDLSSFFKLPNAPKSQFFNLKQGITLTLTSDAVDNEFCDPNSDVSLAGYMNVKGSQFDTNNDKNLFFWMFEKRTSSLIPETSQHKAADVSADDIPLIIWLTGGPGCSSSLALLTENGPCSVNGDGETTSINPYSWTESAHVLWLDQPANVGYSYGQDNDTNEEMISEDAYYFLQAFFQSEDGEKYKNNPLYIIGESYGGHFAPAIAHRIWKGNNDLQDGLLTLNLAGLAIGNGLTMPEIQYQYFAEMTQNNSHNLTLVDEDTYTEMKNAEDLCVLGIQLCNLGDTAVNNFACQKAYSFCQQSLVVPYIQTGLSVYDISKECGDNPLCIDLTPEETFMNSQLTKQKLHVASHNPDWQSCNHDINERFHTDWMKDFSGYVADLINDDIPALIYAGDLDYVCNYLGNKAWVTELQWNDGDAFRAAKDHDWNNGAGLAKTAGKLTFLQVYDAGHQVPTDQPEHALTMITQFLNGETF
jgi:cathepsin A (carboxypeptidase C)